MGELAIMEKNKNVIHFDNPYQFEGKEYTEICVDGLSRLTAQDLCKAQAEAVTGGDTAAAISYKTNLQVLLLLASYGCDKPVEFFKYLPLPEVSKVEAAVRSFF